MEAKSFYHKAVIKKKKNNCVCGADVKDDSCNCV